MNTTVPSKNVTYRVQNKIKALHDKQKLNELMLET